MFTMTDRKRPAAPDWFREMMAEWLIEHGPDRHCDGYEIIADLAWETAKNPPVHVDADDE